MNYSMDYFVHPTVYCDSDNQKVKELARQIIGSNKNKREQTKKIFNFVRNHYLYSFGDWRKKASQSIDNRYGMCTIKTNILVACLRSLNIPAGFRIIRINARNVFGIFSFFSFLKNKISTNSIHIFGAVYLDDKWIDLDPSLDLNLLKGLKKIGYAENLNFDWDGYNDYVNFIPPSEILKDLGLFSNIDEYHLKERKTARFLFNLISNLNIRYYRLLGKIFYD